MVSIIRRQATSFVEDVGIEVSIDKKEDVLPVDSEELQKYELLAGINQKIYQVDKLELNVPYIPNDSFIESLTKCFQFYDETIEEWYTSGQLGMGARFTLAMNIKTGKEIGHPSSFYIWDIVSTFDHCLLNSQIVWHLTVGKDYNGQARKTAAQMERLASTNVTFLGEETIIHLKAPFLFANPDGRWNYSPIDKSLELEQFSSMPFGPVFIEIKDFEHNQLSFPVSTFQYLIDTLERGEAAMESIGKGNYSAVSGWKAFARWMQVYTIPLKGISLPFLAKLRKNLQYRRILFVEYLSRLLDEVISDEKLSSLISHLKSVYEEQVTYLRKLNAENENFESIKQLYFIEQKTLPHYKGLDVHFKETTKRRNNK